MGVGLFRFALAADALADQRQRFPLVWEMAQHGPDGAWRKLATGLESYPLYPYLGLADLRRNIGTVTPAQAKRFLTAWPDSLPAQLWRDAYLAELAHREDWTHFLDWYVPGTASQTLQCHALHARIALGKPVDFRADIEPLWLSAKALPDACDEAIAWARAHGKLSPALLRQRIDLAAEAGQAGVIDAVAKSLSGTAQTDALRIAAAIRDPAGTLAAAATWPDTAHARQAATVALLRLARRDPGAAQSTWTQLSGRLQFDAAQRDRILRRIAIYLAADYEPDALRALTALPAAAGDDSSREWRVRVAIAAQDWQAALAALDALSAEQQADERWRYLRGRVLAKLGRKDAAAKQFEAIADVANFHGFLAADWLQQPYTICPASLGADAATEAALQGNPNLRRAFEFFAIDKLPQARREWDFALTGLNADQRRQALLLAAALGWHDRAIYALNHGADLRHYTLRFPLAQRSNVVRYAHAAGIAPAWAYAIIRAESAWTTDAHSHADAWGLMQLLPGTAGKLAKTENLAFSGAAALVDPDLNIHLGTLYLGKMAQRYDGSPWLASAAYNAGPDPVDRWIVARDSLEPDFFIETIPYKETREYVARVLAFSVIYDWRLHGNALPLASRLPRIGQAWTPPPDNATRKAVVCPATPAASAVAP